MKTTIELPNDLMRAVKIRAVNEQRRLKDVMAEVIRRGLAQGPSDSAIAPAKVAVPLIQCAHPASPEDEMTPARVADILSRDEATAARGAAGEALR